MWVGRSNWKSLHIFRTPLGGPDISVAGNPVLWAADWPVRFGCHQGGKQIIQGPGACTWEVRKGLFPISNSPICGGQNQGEWGKHQSVLSSICTLSTVFHLCSRSVGAALGCRFKLLVYPFPMSALPQPAPLVPTTMPLQSQSCCIFTLCTLLRKVAWCDHPGYCLLSGCRQDSMVKCFVHCLL